MPASQGQIKNIAGHYTATWNAVNIGTTRDGFRIIEQNHDEMVHTDDYGDAACDAVNRGTDVEVELDYAEYALILPLLDSHSNSGGVGTSQGFANSQAGQLASAIALPLVLTAAVGTSAAALDNSPTGFWTFYLTKVITDVDTLLANHARQGRLRLKCYPNSLGRCYLPPATIIAAG